MTKFKCVTFNLIWIALDLELLFTMWPLKLQQFHLWSEILFLGIRSERKT